MTTAGLPLFDSARLESYEKIKPLLNKKQEQVLEALKELGGATFYDVAKHLGWPQSSAVGRLSELCNKKKVIKIVGRRYNAETKSNNTVYSL